MPEIALFQPDIPQNTAAILRTAACFGMDASIIEPAGFQWSHEKMRRAGMDYLDHVSVTRHKDWKTFVADRSDRRIVLATTKASDAHWNFGFHASDVLLFGRESAGVPDFVHDFCQHRITIPLEPLARSLNLAASVAVIASEANRQLST